MKMALSLRPKSAEQYVHMVDEAIIEVDELRSSYEYDAEGMGAVPPYLSTLMQMLTDLRSSMADGSYEFGTTDLPYMGIVNRFRSRIPFADLLAMINKTHKEGLDTESE